MTGTGSMTAWWAGAAAAFLLAVPLPARACDAHQAASADARLSTELKATTAQPEVVAEKCKCDGPSDCTCKKGQCACAKCSKPHHQRYKMVESLRDEKPREHPVHRNAAAGSFI